MCYEEKLIQGDGVPYIQRKELPKITSVFDEPKKCNLTKEMGRILAVLTCTVRLSPRRSPCSAASFPPCSHCNTSFLQGYQCSGILGEKQQGKSHSTAGCLLRESTTPGSAETTLAQPLTNCLSPQRISHLIRYQGRHFYDHSSPELYLPNQGLLDSWLANVAS